MRTLFPFIVIAVSIVAYFMYISPTWNDITALQATKTQYTDALSKAKELKDRRDSILSQYDAIPQTDIDRLQKMMPDTANDVLMVDSVNDTALKYGMIIRAVKVFQAQPTDRTDVATAPSANPYQTTSMTFTVNGTYNQFVSFLHDLETNARLFDVTTLSITADNRSTNNGSTFQYTVGMNAYSLH